MTRLPSLALACVGLALASACDFGEGVSGVDVSATAPLSLTPVFAVAPTAEEIAALDLLRVTLWSAVDSSLVEIKEVDIDPTRTEWSVSFAVRVPIGQDVDRLFYAEAELASHDSTVESVEWSGRSETFQLTRTVERPLELRLVLLYRGPLANLGLSGLSMSRPSIRVVEGATSSLRWSAEGDTTGTVVYFTSGDTTVVTVDGKGVVQSKGPGSTTIYVTAGPVEDSTTVEVVDVALPTEPEVAELLDPPLEYVTSDLFISTFHDAAGGESVRSRFTALRSALQVRDGPAVVGAFEAAKTEWSTYGSGTPLRSIDDPQLGVLELTLQRVAAGLLTAFP